MGLHHDLTDGDIRLIQAITDFQMALSAVDFICELDDDALLHREERCRYQCFEHAAIIAYWRPFSNSYGLPNFGLTDLGIEATPAQLDLHNRIGVHRNKVIAHTDVERMRLSFATHEYDGIKIPMIDSEKGLKFFDERYELMLWLRKLRHAAMDVIFERVQSLPDVRFNCDYLHPVVD